jgi:hypothetical protein
MIDEDLHGMSRDDLVAEVTKLRAGIRQHRDAKGHNLCWWVPELWSLLPESADVRPEAPPRDEFLRCCATYRDTIDATVVELAGTPGREPGALHGRVGSTPTGGTHGS